MDKMINPPDSVRYFATPIQKTTDVADYVRLALDPVEMANPDSEPFPLVYSLRFQCITSPHPHARGKSEDCC
jgi:hypothetical protein